MRCTLRFLGGSSRGGDEVALIPLAPGPGAGGLLGHHAPVVGETLVAGRGLLGDDRVGPVVACHDRLRHAAAGGPAYPPRVQAEPEPLLLPPPPPVADGPLSLHDGPGR